MKNNSVLLIAILSALTGFGVGGLVFDKPVVVCPVIKPCPLVEPCPVCEFNLTGRISEVPSAGLFEKNKLKVSIYFNGLQGIDGFLDSNHNGSFVGTYKGTPASATCSGADKITCSVSYDGKLNNLTF